MASAKNLVVAVVSDHGHGRRMADVKPNVMLSQWGYLKSKSPLRHMIRRWNRKFHSRFTSQKTLKHLDVKQLEHSDFKWIRSKAIVMLAEISGYVHLNVKGRQPYGCVEPGKEYDDIVEDLRRRFSEVTCPVTGKRVFEQVAPPTEMYNVEHIDAERFGDLILVPQAGYTISSGTSKRDKCIKIISRHSLKGCHHPEGIYIFSGQNVNPDGNKKNHIMNIAPTVYAALGARLPRYMDGKPLEDIFSRRLKIQYQEETVQSTAVPPKRQQLSATEEAAVAKRLAELGYLD
jgi:predicted AlkP superfamily phosphohydrolase/phosphomutase